MVLRLKEDQIQDQLWPPKKQANKMVARRSETCEEMRMGAGSQGEKSDRSPHIKLTLCYTIWAYLSQSCTWVSLHLQ